MSASGFFASVAKRHYHWSIKCSHLALPFINKDNVGTLNLALVRIKNFSCWIHCIFLSGSSIVISSIIHAEIITGLG